MAKSKQRMEARIIKEHKQQAPVTRRTYQYRLRRRTHSTPETG